MNQQPHREKRKKQGHRHFFFQCMYAAARKNALFTKTRFFHRKKKQQRKAPSSIGPPSNSRKRPHSYTTVQPLPPTCPCTPTVPQRRTSTWTLPSCSQAKTSLALSSMAFSKKPLTPTTPSFSASSCAPTAQTTHRNQPTGMDNKWGRHRAITM